METWMVWTLDEKYSRIILTFKKLTTALGFQKSERLIEIFGNYFFSNERRSSHTKSLTSSDKYVVDSKASTKSCCAIQTMYTWKILVKQIWKQSFLANADASNFMWVGLEALLCNRGKHRAVTGLNLGKVVTKAKVLIVFSVPLSLPQPISIVTLKATTSRPCSPGSVHPCLCVHALPSARDFPPFLPPVCLKSPLL